MLLHGAGLPADAAPLLARRAVLPLPFLLALPPLRTPAADTFDYVQDGKVKQLTELEARDALTKKVDAATAAGKGIDAERRGGFNEKALFSEDFCAALLFPAPAAAVPCLSSADFAYRLQVRPATNGERGAPSLAVPGLRVRACFAAQAARAARGWPHGPARHARCSRRVHQGFAGARAAS